MGAGPATSQTWTGNTNNDWTVGTNWSGGAEPTNGAVVINTMPNPVLGVAGAETATSGSVIIGTGGGTGNLTIQNGSTLASDALVSFGETVGSNGSATVTGAGSTWTMNVPVINNSFRLGRFGTGTLNIQDGGTVAVTGGTSLGFSNGGSGTLTIESGGTMTNTAFVHLGGNFGTIGVATVRGFNSLLAAGQDLFVGLNGDGTLNIQDNGTVTAVNTTVGVGAASTGAVTIESGGTLETVTLQRGNAALGAVQVDFNNATLRVAADPGGADFVSGFTGTELNLAAGGLTLDSGAFNVTVASPFSGVGGLTKTGAGTLTLTDDNTYTGETLIQDGTLVVTRPFNNTSRVVANGTFDISGMVGAAQIQRLSGSGMVNLGAKTLVLTRANDLFSGTITGTGGLQLGTRGNQTLSGPNNYTGQTTLGFLSTLHAGAANSFSAASAHVVGATTTLDLHGFDQTVASLSLGGTVNIGGAPGTTLTVTGDYAGNNGLINLNTRLGGDASPTDRVVIGGDTSGNTTLRVTNVGGTGAQTVEGIKIIDVVGASNGTFSLLGDYVFQGEQAVVAGAYGYRLYKNGVATPADGDWYLRSALLNPPPGLLAGPLYQPGVPVYETYANVLQSFNSLGTLRQRVGDRTWSAHSFGLFNPEVIGSGQRRGPWGRIEGAHGSFEPKTSTSGATYEVDRWKLQTGADGLLYEGANGYLITGVSVRYGTLSADVDSIFGDGGIDSTGYGLSATITWYGTSGFYLDGQAETTWYDSDLSSKTAARTLTKGNDGFGYGLSLEGGQQIPVSRHWAFTPQTQLTYTEADFDDFTDAFGARVSLDRGDSLVGRLGISADYRNEWRDAAGRLTRSSFYTIANLYYDFLDGSRTDVASVAFTSRTEPLWGGVGVGGSYDWADGAYSLYGEALATTSLDQFGDSHVLSGRAGLRLRW